MLYENYTGSDDTTNKIHVTATGSSLNYAGFGVCFKAASIHQITAAQFYLSRAGTLTGSLNFLFSEATVPGLGVPTTPVASGSLNLTTVPTTSTYMTIPLTASVTLGNKFYCINASMTEGDSSNYLGVRTDFLGAVTNHQTLLQGNSTSSFTNISNLMVPSFRLYGTNSPDADSMWINNSGTWVEFPFFDFFKITKKQNQMSEFEIQCTDISTAQKAYFKEQAEVIFFCGAIMVLKGKIQTIEYKSDYEISARGYGMECKLLEKQFIKSDDNRVQYDNESAQAIITEINSNILTTASSGIFNSDYGNISMRFEFADRLNALGKTAEAIKYYWWVSQSESDTYATNYLNVASSQGNTGSIKTFNLTNNASAISQERDTQNLVNYVNALGYGDGVNQLSTYVYAASTQSSFLTSNISETNTTISIVSGSVFNQTGGEARIAMERVPYATRSGNNLMGCVRGANGTIAKPHNKGCYIEEYYPTTSAQAGSSVSTYGLMDYTLIDKSIIDEETLEVAASGYLSDHKTPIQRITIESDEPFADAALNMGDIVTVTSSEADINGDYHIVGQEFEDNYGVLTMKTEVSNRSLEFIEQMQRNRENADNMAKYMQGATNIYSVQGYENCDATHYLNLRFFVPNEAIAINSVKLNFKLKDFRAYNTANASESAHTHDIPSLDVSGTSSDQKASINPIALWSLGNLPSGVSTGDIPTYIPTGSAGADFSALHLVGSYINWNGSQTDKRLGFGTSSGGFELYDTYQNINQYAGYEVYTMTLTDYSAGTIYFSVRDSSSGGSGILATDASIYMAQNTFKHLHNISGQSTISTTSEAGSAHTHGITYGIYEETLTSPSVEVKCGADGGSLTTVGTYGSDQTDIDITSLVSAVGAGNWVDVQFIPNKRMRIEANAYIQIFIESK